MRKTERETSEIGKLREDNDQLVRKSLQAGFNGGWAAANIGLAVLADKQGDIEFGKWLRDRAMRPDEIEIVDTDSTGAPFAVEGP